MKNHQNKTHNHLFRASLLIVLAGQPLPAATSFVTHFDSAALDPKLVPTYTGAGTALTLGVTAAFTGGADGQYRSYIGTVDSDYAVSTNNWTASIEVFNAGYASDQLFFGLGAGTTTGPGVPIYGEPQGATETQPVTYIALFRQSEARSMVSIRKQADEAYWSNYANVWDAEFDAAVGSSGGASDNAFYRYRMAYDSASKNLTFDVEQISGFGGTVISAGSEKIREVNLAGMGYDSSNGRIFFGGNQSTFDNLSIDVAAPPPVSAVPEASTSLGLLALGAGGLLTRRRLKRAA